MGGGAIVQLVAYGIQDLYLTGDPDITFFKVVYRRHTNFAVESIKQKFSSRADFGQKVTCTIGRTGDLIGQVLLHVRLPPVPKFFNEWGEEDSGRKFAWTNFIGYSLIKETTFEIGGKLIDRQYGEWLYIWEELTTRQNKGSAKLSGNVPQLYEFSNGKNPYDLYIPLKYYFNRNTGLTLPLVALSATDVKITFTFRRIEECCRVGPTYSIQLQDAICPFKPGDYIAQKNGSEVIHGYFINFDYLTKKLSYIKIVSTTAHQKEFRPDLPIFNPLCPDLVVLPDCTEIYEPTVLPPLSFVTSALYINYVFLDNDERIKYTRASHEYLIDQLQYNEAVGIQSPNVGQNLNLSHPCKAHYWVVQLDSLCGARTINDRYNFTDSVLRYPDGRLYGTDLVRSASLILDGNKRFSTRESGYFNLEEPYSRHYRGPTIGINMYSFCFNPEEHQPSGSMNMSKIEFLMMKMKLRPVINPQNMCTIRSYTLNLNILRIFFGLGGIAFT